MLYAEALVEVTGEGEEGNAGGGVEMEGAAEGGAVVDTPANNNRATTTALGLIF